MGSGISAAGFSVIKYETVELAAIFMIVSPLIGLVCGFLFMVAGTLDMSKKLQSQR